MAKRTTTDWEGVKALWRTGTNSNVAIAAQFSCSEAMIRKKAKAEGWKKDLADQVRKAVKEQLVRGTAAEVRASHTQAHDSHQVPPTDEQIVAAAAENPVAVVREHRRDLTAGRDICKLLFSQLNDAALNREELNAEADRVADEEGGPLFSPQLRARFRKALALPTHAGTIRDLSNAMKNFQTLERIAWGLNDTTDTPADYEKQLKALQNEPAAE